MVTQHAVNVSSQDIAGSSPAPGARRNDDQTIGKQLLMIERVGQMAGPPDCSSGSSGRVGSSPTALTKHPICRMLHFKTATSGLDARSCMLSALMFDNWRITRESGRSGWFGPLDSRLDRWCNGNMLASNPNAEGSIPSRSANGIQPYRAHKQRLFEGSSPSFGTRLKAKPCRSGQIGKGNGSLIRL